MRRAKGTSDRKKATHGEKSEEKEVRQQDKRSGTACQEDNTGGDCRPVPNKKKKRKWEQVSHLLRTRMNTEAGMQLSAGRR